MKCRVSIPLQVAPSATPRRPQRGLEVVGNSTPGSGNGALSVLDGHRVTSTLALPSASYGRERHPRHWPAGPRGGRQPNESRRNKLRDRRDRQPRNPYEVGRHRLVRRASGLFTGRLANVQSQAQSWLAVMSTLLGLYSAVIVVNGGAAIGELRGGPLFGFPCVLVGVCSGGLGSAQHLRTFGGLSGPVPRVSNQGQPRKQRPLLKKLWDPEGIQPEAGGWLEYRNYILR